MLNSRSKGILFAIVAAVAYGTNPLFSLPLYAEGLTPDSVLLYRYGFGIIILGLSLVFKKESLSIRKKEILPLFIFGLLFACSSLFLYQSFLYMDAGVASTILFIYPVLVAVIMVLFFKEKGSWLTYLCIFLAMIGIALLYKGNGETVLNTTGLLLVALSSLSYAIYIVGVNHSSIRTMSSGKMTFWVMLFGCIVFVCRTRFFTEFQVIQPTFYNWVNVIGIALFPTIISILCINISIKNIGPTNAAIFGALEPVTALIIGIFIFHETITIRIVSGALLILIAVTLLISANKITEKFRKSYDR